jgi:hypothetical protein
MGLQTLKPSNRNHQTIAAAASELEASEQGSILNLYVFFACLHEDTNSLRLFKVANSGLHIIYIY